MFGTIEVEFGIDDVNIDKIKDKITELRTELEEKKSQLGVELDPQKKAEIEGDIEQIQSQIDGLSGVVDLEMNITGLGEVGKVFDDYTSKMETLASIQSELANGFTISAEKAREFAAVYPDILANATTTADGQIRLNSDVASNFVNMKREEINAAIDAEIAKIDADMSRVRSQRTVSSSTT